VNADRMRCLFFFRCRCRFKSVGGVKGESEGAEEVMGKGGNMDGSRGGGGKR